MFATHRTISRRFSSAVIAAAAFAVLAGCGPTQPEGGSIGLPQSGGNGAGNGRSSIRGTASATPGVNADLRALRITAHASLDHLRNYVRSGLAKVSGSGLDVSWIMSVTPGTYFILAWADLDNSGTLTYGDVVGIVGQYGLQYGDFTPVQVWEGQTTDAGDIKCEVLYTKPAWLEGDITDK